MLLRKKTNIRSLNNSPLFNVLMFSFFWASQIFLTKLGLITGPDILGYQVIMILVAMVVIMVLLLPSSRYAFLALFNERPRLFWQLFTANAIQAGFGTTLSIVGIGLTDAINAGFLVKMSVVSTTLLAFAILGESLSRRKIILLCLMVGGAYLLTTNAQTLIPRSGDLLILSACVCWSLGTVLVRKVLKENTVQADVVTIQKPIAGITVFSGFILISVFASRHLGDLDEIFACCSISPPSLPLAIASGFCLGITWIYLFRTLQVATASYMTMVSMITPVLVSILAMIFLDESLYGLQIIGAIMILTSGILVSKNQSFSI